MKTAFIDLDFHLTQTKSSQFFIDILRTIFPDLYIVGANNAWHEIPLIKPDTIIIWQKIFTPQEIDSWQAKNVVFIPMLDAVPLTKDFWTQYRQYKIFCFSKTLFSFLKQRGFSVFYNQYYAKPTFSKAPSAAAEKPLRIFYWERSEKINWPLVSCLLGAQKIGALHYHYSTNIAEKNHERPTQTDIEKYSITFSDWFADNSAFAELLAQNDVFIAPRETEGIGLSFIEALAAGNCVAAYDAPTMNEYITDSENGFLFTEKTCIPLNLTREKVEQLKVASQKQAEIGYNTWIGTIPAMLDFIKTPLQNYAPKIHLPTFLCKRTRAEIRHVYKKMRNSVKPDDTNYTR